MPDSEPISTLLLRAACLRVNNAVTLTVGDIARLQASTGLHGSFYFLLYKTKAVIHRSCYSALRRVSI